jgi:acylpyruvate hydrolase
MLCDNRQQRLDKFFGGQAMKLSMIKGPTHDIPVAQLSSSQYFDLRKAAALGLLGQTAEPHVLEDIINLDSPLYRAVIHLINEIEGSSRSTALLDQLEAAQALHSVGGADHAPILRPRVIICGGMAYRDHNKEMNVATPSNPTGFLKSPGAITAHNQPIVLPPNDSGLVDFECEFSLVIGKPMYKVAEADALSYIAGVTMLNDVSSRVVVPEFVSAMKGTDPMACLRYNNINIFEKQHPTFCPIGPVIETLDSYGDPNEFSVETRLNGEVMQSAHSNDLVFTLSQTLSFFSQWFRLMPGDVVTTGSPAGVGFAHNPPRLMKEGDVVEVSGSKVGALRNRVVKYEPNCY